MTLCAKTPHRAFPGFTTLFSPISLPSVPPHHRDSVARSSEDRNEMLADRRSSPTPHTPTLFPDSCDAAWKDDFDLWHRSSSPTSDDSSLLTPVTSPSVPARSSAAPGLNKRERRLSKEQVEKPELELHSFQDGRKQMAASLKRERDMYQKEAEMYSWMLVGLTCLLPLPCFP